MKLELFRKEGPEERAIISPGLDQIGVRPDAVSELHEKIEQETHPVRAELVQSHVPVSQATGEVVVLPSLQVAQPTTQSTPVRPIVVHLEHPHGLGHLIQGVLRGLNPFKDHFGEGSLWYGTMMKLRRPRLKKNQKPLPATA